MENGGIRLDGLVQAIRPTPSGRAVRPVAAVEHPDFQLYTFTISTICRWLRKKNGATLNGVASR